MTVPHPPANPIASFSAELRSLAADRTIGDLAGRTGLLTETVKLLLAGEQLFSWEVTSVFLDACDATPHQWRPRWERLAREKGRRVWSRKYDPVGAFPDPDSARSIDEFVDLMQKLRVHAGELTYQTLEDRAKVEHRRLPHTTVNAVMKKRTRPQPDLVEAFVEACGLPLPERRRWRMKWMELVAQGQGDHTATINGAQAQQTVPESPSPPIPIVSSSAPLAESASTADSAPDMPPPAPKRLIRRVVLGVSGAFLLLAGIGVGRLTAAEVVETPILGGPPYSLIQDQPLSLPYKLPMSRDWHLDLRLTLGHTPEGGLQNCTYYGQMLVRIERPGASPLEYKSLLGHRNLTLPRIPIGRTDSMRIVVTFKVVGRPTPALDGPCQLTLDLNGSTVRAGE
ncbi:hypothetical protein [Acrocarpospora macrocephala]|nr:hypothetical protein [Acrocarpospora macrocephala]